MAETLIAGARPLGGHRLARRLRSWLPWLLIAPTAISILGMVGYPLLRTLWLSLHEGKLLDDGDFVGLGNYIGLAADPLVQAAFLRTLVFTTVAVAGSMVVALIVALVLNSGLPGMAVLTILVVLPWAMPRVSAAILWKWAFDSQYGVVNWALTSIGLEQFDGYGWFSSGPSALFVIALAVVWAKVPFLAIALLAGLKSVPEDVVEAARMDGASPLRILLRIKLPMMMPVVTVLLVLATIQAFQAFDHVFVMTVPPGGPAHSTEILPLLTYLEAFGAMNFGNGSALAIITFLILGVVTYFYIRLQRKNEVI